MMPITKEPKNKKRVAPANEILNFKLEFDDDMKLSLNKVWSG